MSLWLNFLIGTYSYVSVLDSFGLLSNVVDLQRVFSLFYDTSPILSQNVLGRHGGREVGTHHTAPLSMEDVPPISPSTRGLTTEPGVVVRTGSFWVTIWG